MPSIFRLVAGATAVTAVLAAPAQATQTAIRCTGTETRRGADFQRTSAETTRVYLLDQSRDRVFRYDEASAGQSDRCSGFVNCEVSFSEARIDVTVHRPDRATDFLAIDRRTGSVLDWYWLLSRTDNAEIAFEGICVPTDLPRAAGPRRF